MSQITLDSVKLLAEKMGIELSDFGDIPTEREAALVHFLFHCDALASLPKAKAALLQIMGRTLRYNYSQRNNQNKALTEQEAVTLLLRVRENPTENDVISHLQKSHQRTKSQ
jgi:hypothetical protein